MQTSHARRSRPGWIAALLAGALLLGAQADARPADRGAPDAAPYETIIRATYARLQDYVRAADRELRVEIGDLRTYRPEEFAGVRWLDVVDMPGGAMIDVTRAVRQHEHTRRAGVRYEPSWNEGADHAVTPEREAAHARASLAGVLRAASDENADLREVRAVTSFAVQVTLDGRSRSYRAAFAWLPHSLTAYRFVVADNIVQGVEEAAREALPAWSRDDELADLRLVEEPPPPPGGGSLSCNPSSTTTSVIHEAWGSDGHWWGSHTAEATLSISCTCDSTCGSTCSASISNGSCSDSGFTDQCHKLATASKASTNRNDNGATSGASCAAGYGCVKKGCLFCMCGLSVSVSVFGASVQFSTSGGSDWEGNGEYGRTCGVCEPVEPPPPPPPPGGGGGGGGGSPPPGPCGGFGTQYDFDCGNDGSWEYLGVCVYSGQSAADVGCSLCFGSPLHQPGSGLAAGNGLMATCSGFNLRATGASAGGVVRAVLSPVAALTGASRPE